MREEFWELVYIFAFLQVLLGVTVFIESFYLRRMLFYFWFKLARLNRTFYLCSLNLKIGKDGSLQLMVRNHVCVSPFNWNHVKIVS